MKLFTGINIYQCYFPSFVTNINELINKLSYLKSLSVDYIWLSPFYISGEKDGGYDIIDYYNINPNIGNHNDFNKLIKKSKEYNIKIMIDMVLNHTSFHHKWFNDSIEKKNNKENWYIWVDNIVENWQSEFEKSPWTWNEQRQQYYYHYFYTEQPDLNFENPLVINEIKNILTFWMDKGVEGFRMDAIGCYLNNYPEPNLPNKKNSQLNTNKNFKFLEEFIEFIKSYGLNNYNNKILILGETEYNTEYEMNKYTELLDLNMNYNLSYLNKLDAKLYFNELDKWYKLNLKYNKYPLFYLNNHDRLRQRYGEQNEKIAKFIFALTHVQWGYKIIYYGDEINMKNSEINSNFDIYGRDTCRADFPWKNKNFRIEPHKDDKNIDYQFNNDDSFFNWFKKFLLLVKEYPILENYELINNNIYIKRLSDKKRINFIFDFDKIELTFNIHLICNK